MFESFFSGLGFIVLLLQPRYSVMINSKVYGSYFRFAFFGEKTKSPVYDKIFEN